MPATSISKLTALFFGVLILSNDSPGAELRLEDFVQRVSDANPSLRASRLRADAQAHRVKPARTLDDPFIAFGPDEVPFGGGMGMFRYQVSQTVPFPGKLGARGDAAEKRAEAARADSETQGWQLKTRATQLFYRLYWQEQAIQANRNALELVRATLESARSRYATGSAPAHHEWLLARVESKSLEIEKIRLEREAKVLRAQMNELLNQPTNAELGIPSPQFEPMSHSELTEAPTDSQPELRSMTLEKEAAEADKRSALLSYAPDFVLQGMTMKSSHGSEDPSTWGAMVGVTIPLYWFRKQAELSAASSRDLEAAEQEKLALTRRLETERATAEQELKSARDTRRLYETQVLPATELALQNGRSGYAARRLPLSQYLQTLRLHQTQKLEAEASRIDVELAKTRLRYLLANPAPLKLTPMRPSLLESMGSGMGEMDSSATSMGRGMSPPAKQGSKRSRGAPSPSDSGMGGMGGM